MTPPKQFYDDNAARHRQVIRRLRERFDQKRDNLALMTDCQAAWDASIAEVQAGACQGPFTVSSIEKRYGYARLRVIVRHVVHQGKKIRAVNDARANSTNAAFASSETVGLMAADCPVAIAQEFLHRSESECWNDDFNVGGSVDDGVSKLPSPTTRADTRRTNRRRHRNCDDFSCTGCQFWPCCGGHRLLPQVAWEELRPNQLGLASSL